MFWTIPVHRGKGKSLRNYILKSIYDVIIFIRHTIITEKNTYLALVGSIIPLLHVFYLEVPVVTALGMDYLEPFVVCVCE